MYGRDAQVGAIGGSDHLHPFSIFIVIEDGNPLASQKII